MFTPLSDPKAIRAKTSFLGKPRTVTRHVLYADDDFDADRHPVDRVDMDKDMNDLYEDPMAEAKNTIVEEDPETIAQFRADLASTEFRQLVQQGVVHADGPTPVQFGALRSQALRTPASLLSQARVADRRIFSANYLRCLPDTHTNTFVKTPLMQGILVVLVPAMYTPDKPHWRESRFRRLVAETGAEWDESETRTFDGPATHYIPDDEDGDIYAPDDAHLHFDADSQTTAMRLIRFTLKLTSIDDQNNVKDEKMHLHCVCHLVDPADRASREEDPVVCFRTFYISK